MTAVMTSPHDNEPADLHIDILVKSGIPGDSIPGDLLSRDSWGGSTFADQFWPENFEDL
jgi:hypothetical protein